jgi:hypothetical protein
MKDQNEKDDPKTAPESGDPLSSGRSRGKIVSDNASDDETERAGDETDAPEAEAPESGRHAASPPSTRPNLGTQGA